ncbi:hypothetical protein GQ457_06G024620 [Hibiscus cannabinus]
MEGFNGFSSTSVVWKQSAINVKEKFTRRTMINKSLNLVGANAAMNFTFLMFPSWEKKKRVVGVSRVMNLGGGLRTFLVEVKPALPAAVARALHLFCTASAIVSVVVAWTAGIFIE